MWRTLPGPGTAPSANVRGGGSELPGGVACRGEGCGADGSHRPRHGPHRSRGGERPHDRPHRPGSGRVRHRVAAHGRRGRGGAVARKRAVAPGGTTLIPVWRARGDGSTCPAQPVSRCSPDTVLGRHQAEHLRPTTCSVRAVSVKERDRVERDVAAAAVRPVLSGPVGGAPTTGDVEQVQIVGHLCRVSAPAHHPSADKETPGLAPGVVRLASSARVTSR
jgi:hypothetical protein